MQGFNQFVGRIDQHEVVTAPLCGEEAKDVVAHHTRAGQPELFEVALDRAAGGAVGLDEDRALGAARERLQPHRARAGEEVEHRGAVDRPDEVEGGLANAVTGRPGVHSFRGVDGVALAATGDDSHANSHASSSIRPSNPASARPRSTRTAARRLPQCTSEQTSGSR